MRLSSLCIVALCAGTLPAQTFAFSPAGTANREGNLNNTIPFWSFSATYQQIHDYENMVKTLANVTPVLNGLSFRQSSLFQGLTGRSLDVQVSMAATTNSSRTFTTTFAANLGGSFTVVLPYTRISLPSLTSSGSPNPPGWIVPFTSPFQFLPTPGVHLCWEWRHRAASNNLTAALDAVNGNEVQSVASEGSACLAMGQTQPAAIRVSTLDLRTPTFRNILDRAAPGVIAVFALGAQRANLQLPGQCQPLLLNPLVTVPGGTDTVGTWDLSIPTPDLRGRPQVELFGQFVWLDGMLPLGLGLSEMTVVTTPPSGANFITRLYSAPLGGGNGFDLATTAQNSDVGLGLVIGFLTP